MTTTPIVSTATGEVTELTISGGPLLTGTMTAEDLAERKARLSSIAELPSEGADKISSEYWEARSGDKIRGEFLGYKILEKKDDQAEDGVKRIPAVVIDTLEGIRLCGAMQIVENFQTGVAPGSPVEVTCTEAKAGQMKKFEVLVLKAKG